MRPLRIGVLGAARIAPAFCSGVAGSDAVSVVAVASHDRDKSCEFAAEFGIACSYGSYNALLASPDVDAVYIPLPNALHAEWAAPAVWHHDVFHADGTPYRQAEIDLIRHLTEAVAER